MAVLASPGRPGLGIGFNPCMYGAEERGEKLTKFYRQRLSI